MKTTTLALKSMRLTLAAGMLAAMTFAGHVLADDATVNSTDKSFIENAYQDGLREVQMGKLGEGKTANTDVKAFAEKMVTDHSVANGELKALAASKKVDVPADPSLLSQGRVKLLDMKSGADFDKAFVDDMVTDHKKAVDSFEKATNSADPDVKAFAAKTLPTLKAHLSMAEGLQNKVGK